MPNEIVTILITDEKVTMVSGKLPRAKLAFQSAGLDIYKKGSSQYHHEDFIPNMAMNACLARHIPVISLRRVK